MSLVTTPTRALAVCPVCAGTRVTEISMVLTDGSAVEFASCHACEHKGWTKAGRPLDISSVLLMARKEKVVR